MVDNVGVRRTIVDSIDTTQRLVGEIDVDAIGELVDLHHKAWETGARIFVAGNGGSAWMAAHWATDISGLTLRHSGKALECINVAGSCGDILMIGNDEAFEDVLATSMLHHAPRKGDVVIALSGSGRSKNILRLVRVAKERGLWTLGISGNDEQYPSLATVADQCIAIGSTNMQQIENLHLVIMHQVLNSLLEILPKKS